MFTREQLNQLQKLFDFNNQKIREEIQIEAQKTRTLIMHLEARFNNLEDKFKDLKIEVQSHTKILKQIKRKLNKTAKTVDVIGRMFDKDILENRKRIDRIENIFGI